MDVSLTFDPDVPGRSYMVVAGEVEWAEVLSDLQRLAVISLETQDLIEGLKSWGVGE